MTPVSTFVELDKQRHDRNHFDCGEAELNQFLLHKAAKHMHLGVSMTWVLPATQIDPAPKIPLCAFFTLAPSSIERQSLPPQVARKLPHYPVPVYLLAQMAVDKAYQGKGLGKITLITALKQIWQVNAHMPAVAVIVDCLNSQAQDFYASYGFAPLLTQSGKTRLFLSMSEVRFLFTEQDSKPDSSGLKF